MPQYVKLRRIFIASGTICASFYLSACQRGFGEAVAPPTFEGDSNISVAENKTNVGTIKANDRDEDTVTFSITGGADREFFEINAQTGALTFKEAPDYETPTDSNKGNDYVVEITASDNDDHERSREYIIKVTDVSESDDTQVASAQAKSLSSDAVFPDQLVYFDSESGLRYEYDNTSLEMRAVDTADQELRVITSHGVGSGIAPAPATQWVLDRDQNRMILAGSASDVLMSIDLHSGHRQSIVPRCHASSKGCSTNSSTSGFARLRMGEYSQSLYLLPNGGAEEVKIDISGAAVD